MSFSAMPSSTIDFRNRVRSATFIDEVFANPDCILNRLLTSSVSLRAPINGDIGIEETHRISPSRFNTRFIAMYNIRYFTQHVSYLASQLKTERHDGNMQANQAAAMGET